MWDGRFSRISLGILIVIYIFVTHVVCFFEGNEIEGKLITHNVLEDFRSIKSLGKNATNTL